MIFNTQSKLNLFLNVLAQSKYGSINVYKDNKSIFSFSMISLINSTFFFDNVGMWLKLIFNYFSTFYLYIYNYKFYNFINWLVEKLC